MDRRMIVMFLLLAVPALGQVQLPSDDSAAGTAPPATVSKNPGAIGLAHQALSAMGGAQGVAIYQDSLTTGTLTLPGDKPKTFSVVIKTKGAKNVRVELTNAEGTRVRVLNQGQAAIQYPDGKVRKLLMNNTLAERVSHIPIFSLLAEANDASVIAEYVGPAQMAGGPIADVIALRPVPIQGMSQEDLDRSTTKTLFYIDRPSGMVTKVEYFLFSESDPDEKTRVETYFSDFRSINGASVPFHQTTYEDGKLAEDLTISSAAFNVGISDTDFTLPTEVANAQ